MNDDDDNRNAIPDKDDTSVTKENDLAQLWWFFAKTIEPPRGATNWNLNLESAGSARFWKARNKGTQESIPTQLGDNFVRNRAFVEGNAASAAFRDGFLRGRCEECQDKADITVDGISTIRFEGITPAGDNETQFFPNGNFNEPGGDRIHPDRRTPNGPLHNKVKVKVFVQPIDGPPTDVYVRPFDVDDPSAGSKPIDDEEDKKDNRGKVNGKKEGEIVGADADGVVKKQTANGEAEFEFEVTRQPGDNFRICASLTREGVIEDVKARQGDLEGKLYNKDETKELPNNENAASLRKQSNLLTVWRTLHIERDSMVAPTIEQNRVRGQITAIAPHDLFGDRVQNLTIDQGLDDEDQYGTLFMIGTGGDGKPQGQIIDSAGRVFGPVTNREGDAPQRISVQPLAGGVVPQVGDFTLTDDDIAGPLLPESLFQTDYMARAYREAYIEPKLDGGGDAAFNRLTIPFHLNLESGLSGGRKARLELDPDVSMSQAGAMESDANRNDDYWVAYVQVAFQGGIDEDNDPDLESFDTPYGVTTELHGKASWVFLETIMDGSRKLREAQINLVLDQVTAHEIGHQFGLDDLEDKSLMGAPPFNPPKNNTKFRKKDLKHLRDRVVSPGRTP